MSIPTTIREYHNQGKSHHDFVIQNAPLLEPKASEVTIKIHAVSLQFRDLSVSKGNYPGQKENVIPCSDGAGEIVALGEEVKGWKIGDRVCPNFNLDHIHGDVTEAIKNTGLGGQIDGVLRDHINVPAHSLVRIPSYLTYEEASTLPCAALTAYNALHGPVPLKGGDSVLVLGTGGVSIFGVQIALASGATIIVTSSSDVKLEIAKRLGAQHLINYNTNPNWEDDVLKITEGRGVDHIIEVGGDDTILKSLRAVRYAGQISIVGSVSGSDKGIPIRSTTHKAVTLHGIFIGSVKQFEDMNRLFTARQIHPVIDKVFSFKEAIEAYSYLESQRHVGKVVIRVTED